MPGEVGGAHAAVLVDSRTGRTSPAGQRRCVGLTFGRGKCRDLIRKHRNEGVFTPPDSLGTSCGPQPGRRELSGISYDARHSARAGVVNPWQWS